MQIECYTWNNIRIKSFTILIHETYVSLIEILAAFLRFNILSVSTVTVYIIRLFRFGVYHLRKASVKESISFFDECQTGNEI